jgi:putative transposase
MEVSEAQRLRALEDENRRLKQPVAEQALDNQALRFLIEKKVLRPDDERKAVELIQEAFGTSQRRACKIVGADRATIRYEKKLTKEHQILDRMKNLLEERPRFGCSRVPSGSPR